MPWDVMKLFCSQQREQKKQLSIHASSCMARHLLGCIFVKFLHMKIRPIDFDEVRKIVVCSLSRHKWGQ
jgi:hypothetical protein